MEKQTAGRNTLGEFAPKFAELNDDVLFGQVWAREDRLSPKMRSIITVVTLVSKGLFDTSFQHHLMTAKKNGVTKSELAEILDLDYGDNLDSQAAERYFRDSVATLLRRPLINRIAKLRTDYEKTQDLHEKREILTRIDEYTKKLKSLTAGGMV